MGHRVRAPAVTFQNVCPAVVAFFVLRLPLFSAVCAPVAAAFAVAAACVPVGALLLLLFFLCFVAAAAAGVFRSPTVEKPIFARF